MAVAENLIVGLFDHPAEARSATTALEDAGISPSEISVDEGVAGPAEGSGEDEAAGEEARPGLWERVKSFFGFGIPEEERGYYQEGVLRGGILVSVRAVESQAEMVREIMEQHHAVDIDELSTETTTAESEELVSEIPLEKTTITRTPDDGVPVVEEELHVGERELRRGGVRIYSRITEVETTEVTVISEEAHVVDEVFVDREVSERREVAEENIQHVEVEVEPSAEGRPAPAAANLGAADIDDEAFRDHYVSHFSDGGAGYEQLVPAYRFGHRLGLSDDLRNASWDEVEAKVRSSWEENDPGTWATVRDAVRHAFKSARDRLGSDARGESTPH